MRCRLWASKITFSLLFDITPKSPYIASMGADDQENNFLAGLVVVGVMAFVIWFGLSISVKWIWIPPAIFLALAFGSGFLDTWDELTNDTQTSVNPSGRKDVFS